MNVSDADKRIELALAAGRMGTWEWHAADDRVHWSPALEQMHGIPEGSFAGTLDAFERDIHPDDRERVLATMQRSLRTGDDHRVEYRIVRPDGEVRWLEAIGAVWRDDAGAPGGMRGVCADVTARKTAELALREREARFATTLASIGDAVIATGVDGRIRYMNAVAESLTGWSAADAGDRPIAEVFRIEDERTGLPVGNPVAAALRDGTTAGLSHPTLLVRRDGRALPVDDSAAPIRDAGGEILGAVLVFRDVSARRREELRQAFMVEATRVLASSLDDEQTLRVVAQLAVPRVADWCAVDVLDAGGGIRRVAVAHSDPRKVALAHEIHHRYPPDPDGPHGVAKILRTGESELIATIDDDMLRAATQDDEHLRIVRDIGVGSYMGVAIRGARRVLGVVSFVSERSHVFGQEDLRLAEQLCHFAAIALENGRLYRLAQQARADAERASLRAARLQAVTAALALAQTPSEVADVAMDHMLRHMNASSSVLFLLRDGSCERFAHRGVPEGSVTAFSLDAPLPLAAALRTRQPQWIESREALLAAYPNMKASPMPADRLQSVGAIPLVVRGGVIGGLAFSFAEPRTFDAAERDMLLSMTDQIAQSFERASLREGEKALLARLQASEARYRYIFEAAAVGIAEKDYTHVKAKLDALVASGVDDPAGYLEAHPEFVEEAVDLVRVRAVNPAMLQLLRASEPAELATLRAIFLPESRAFFVEELLALMEGARVVSGDTTLRKLDGERVEVLATVAFPATGFDRVLICRTDITEQKQMLAERQELVDKLSSTVRLNEMFAGILAHDLRNPLSAIVSAAQLLIRRTDDDRIRRPIDRILSSGERMARMIEQLLDFTRIRVAGGLALERRDVVLEHLCAKVLAELEVIHPQRRLNFEWIGNTTGSWDPDRLEQVISNLAGNACQHADSGTPVRVHLDGSQAKQVILSIASRGEIPADQIGDLFDPFRGTTRRSRNAQGLGLGLFITRQIVIAHGGEVSVESAGGETVFRVQLPRRAP